MLILEAAANLIEERASPGAVAARANRMSGKNKRIERLRETQTNVSGKDVQTLKRKALDKTTADVESRRKSLEKRKSGGFLSKVIHKKKTVKTDKSGNAEIRDLAKHRLFKKSKRTPMRDSVLA